MRRSPFAALAVVAVLVTGLAPSGTASTPTQAQPPFSEATFARPRAPLPPPSREVSRGPDVPATETRARSAPVNEGSFLGITGNGNISPADPTGAAGVSHVVTAVNVDYAVYPKGSIAEPPAAPPPLAAGSLGSLFPNLPAGTITFDPKVVYDHYRGRFVLVFLAGHGPPFSKGARRSYILVVSIPDGTASDPNTWCKRRLNGDQTKKDGQQLADFPGLGFDRRNVYVTSNQFGFGRQESFEYAQILALGKSSLYNCGRKLKVKAFGGKETRNPGRRAGPAFTIQPAITETEIGKGKTEYLVSFDDQSCGPICGKRMTIWRIVRRKGRLQLAKDSVKTPRGVLAPPGTQRDGSANCQAFETCWDPGDLRLVTAFYDADRDRLYTAHTVQSDISPGDNYIEASVRWYEVDPSPIKKSKLTRTGLIGEPQRDSGWPAVATDAAGTLFVTFSRAGAPPPGEYLSSVAATIPPGATSPDAVTVLMPGESTYVADPGRFQRWGDYAAASRDPVDPLDVWLVNQYARSDGTPTTTNIWQQIVHRTSSV